MSVGSVQPTTLALLHPSIIGVDGGSAQRCHCAHRCHRTHRCYDQPPEPTPAPLNPVPRSLSRRNVCVSTVGPNPHLIGRMAELPCRLAWSVHAADDSLRKLLVPTTRDSMEQLRDAFITALAAKPGGDKSKGLLVELALSNCPTPPRSAHTWPPASPHGPPLSAWPALTTWPAPLRVARPSPPLFAVRGINDQAEHAEQLAHLLHPFGRSDVLVNLIPYNENGLSVGGELIKQSSMEDVYGFQRALWSKGVLCTVRATRGEQERSACGQLATEVAEGAAKARKEARKRAAEPEGAVVPV